MSEPMDNWKEKFEEDFSERRVFQGGSRTYIEFNRTFYDIEKFIESLLADKDKRIKELEETLSNVKLIFGTQMTDAAKKDVEKKLKQALSKQPTSEPDKTSEKELDFDSWLLRYFRLCHPEHGGTLYQAKHFFGKKYSKEELQQLHKENPDCDAIKVVEKSIPASTHPEQKGYTLEDIEKALRTALDYGIGYGDIITITKENEFIEQYKQNLGK